MMIDTLPRCTHKLRNAVRELHRTAGREEQQAFLAEGPPVCLDLLAAGVSPASVIIRDDATEESRSIAAAFLARGADVYACGGKDMERMSDATTASDILMTVPMFDEGPAGPAVVILDGVADPGNVGTIIRTAAWFGCTDVILSSTCADVYSPKVVRSTAGALARLNIRRRKDLLAELAAVADRPILATTARAGRALSDVGPLSTFALIIGSEAHGISADVLRRATTAITIEGGHGTESLNAAVAAAIVLYSLTR
jgi:TrmH family RNA methyltransferase